MECGGEGGTRLCEPLGYATRLLCKAVTVTLSLVAIHKGCIERITVYVRVCGSMMWCVLSKIHGE